MSKLLKLKEWLTVEDAAKYLSISSEEQVEASDIFRLALDGHLSLSVNFVNHAYGRPARVETLGPQHISNAPFFNLCGPPQYPSVVEELLPNRKEVLIYEGDMYKPKTLKGVWDLPMIGGEVLDVEHAYQQLVGGPSVSLVCLDGPLVASADRSKFFQVLSRYERSTAPQKSNKPETSKDTRGALSKFFQVLNRFRSTSPQESSKPAVMPKISKDTREALDRMNAILGPVTLKAPEEVQLPRWDYETEYYPSDTLPEDSMFVVRVAALRELEEKLFSDNLQQEKPLHPSERKSVSQIIAALADMADLDLSAPYKADEILRQSAARTGLELPGSTETVVKFFKATKS